MSCKCIPLKFRKRVPTHGWLIRYNRFYLERETMILIIPFVTREKITFQSTEGDLKGLYCSAFNLQAGLIRGIASMYLVPTVCQTFSIYLQRSSPLNHIPATYYLCDCVQWNQSLWTAASATWSSGVSQSPRHRSLGKEAGEQNLSSPFERLFSGT